MAKYRQVTSYQHLLVHVTAPLAPARCLSGNTLREWPIECLVPSMTATTSLDEELHRVQILLKARATERERGIHYGGANVIEQSPDQLDEIQTASDRDLAVLRLTPIKG